MISQFTDIIAHQIAVVKLSKMRTNFLRILKSILKISHFNETNLAVVRLSYVKDN